MATSVSHHALLDNLTKSLLSTLECSENFNNVSPVEEGISLLDTKNEIFLSYLHNLVFLIIVKLRNNKNRGTEADLSLDDSIVKKLVELQVSMDKGVRPLENRLKYQIEKVLRAADDAKLAENVKATTVNQSNIRSRASEEIDEESDDDSAGGVDLNNSEINDLQYRPNPAAFIRPKDSGSSTKQNDSGLNQSQIYRPPRIHATSMPTTGPRDHEAKKPRKSSTLDEFIYTEMSTVPIAEPSIGSTILGGGKRSKTEKERIQEQERIDYEERNYTRLPKESKKELANKKGRRTDAGYGGEDWGGLGYEIDRIDQLTKKSGKKISVLEKSRKRPKEDTKANDPQIGQGFRKRLKTLGKRKHSTAF